MTPLIVLSSLQVMTPGLYYYYVTELAFYWSLVFSQFTDIKRKVSGTGAVWSTRATAVTIGIILDDHMFAVLRSRLRGRAPPPSVEALYVHPLSCDLTGIILLEFSDFNRIERRPAWGKWGSLRTLFWVLLYTRACPWDTSSPPPVLPPPAADTSHDLLVRCTRLLKFLVPSGLRLLRYAFIFTFLIHKFQSQMLVASLWSHQARETGHKSHNGPESARMRRRSVAVGSHGFIYIFIEFKQFACMLANRLPIITFCTVSLKLFLVFCRERRERERNKACCDMQRESRNLRSEVSSALSK